MGDAFAVVAQFQTAQVAQNRASNSLAEFAIPYGAQSCILHTLRWIDGGSCDVFGKAGNLEIWLNRVNMGQTSTTVGAGNIYSGNTVQLVASRLS